MCECVFFYYLIVDVQVEVPVYAKDAPPLHRPWLSKEMNQSSFYIRNFKIGKDQNIFFESVKVGSLSQPLYDRR